MHTAFQTKHEIYLAMEYCPGGDLREFLEAIGALEEQEVKLWFAEMIIAVNALHEMGYIHRDLKPDNFLIDAKGHIKLGDFGLSKETGARPKLTDEELRRLSRSALASRVLFCCNGTRERLTTDNFANRFPTAAAAQSREPPTHRPNATAAVRIMRRPSIVAHKPIVGRKLAFSVVGSPDYMSPEVIKGRTKQGPGYSEEVDWWSLGCVFFECILGEPPFSGSSVEEVFSNIENWTHIVPDILKTVEENITPECNSLLSGFLSAAQNRLGIDICLLKNHPFFMELDWDHLEDITSPFVPGKK